MKPLSELLQQAYALADPRPSIAQLARDAGVHQPNLWRALRAKQATSEVMLSRVLDALGYDIALVKLDEKTSKR